METKDGEEESEGIEEFLSEFGYIIRKKVGENKFLFCIGNMEKDQATNKIINSLKKKSPHLKISKWEEVLLETRLYKKVVTKK